MAVDMNWTGSVRGWNCLARAVFQDPAAIEADHLAKYPIYEVIKSRQVTEVIEHRQMEPIFYITDDAAVKVKLGVTK